MLLNLLSCWEKLSALTNAVNLRRLFIKPPESSRPSKRLAKHESFTLAMRTLRCWHGKSAFTFCQALCAEANCKRASCFNSPRDKKFACDRLPMLPGDGLLANAGVVLMVSVYSGDFDNLFSGMNVRPVRKTISTIADRSALIWLGSQCVAFHGSGLFRKACPINLSGL